MMTGSAFAPKKPKPKTKTLSGRRVLVNGRPISKKKSFRPAQPGEPEGPQRFFPEVPELIVALEGSILRLYVDGVAVGLVQRFTLAADHTSIQAADHQPRGRIDIILYQNRQVPVIEKLKKLPGMQVYVYDAREHYHPLGEFAVKPRKPERAAKKAKR